MRILRTGSILSSVVDFVVAALVIGTFWVLPLAATTDLSTTHTTAGVGLASLVLAGVLLRWRWPLAATVAVLLATAAGWLLEVSSDPMLAAAWCLYPLVLRRGSRVTGLQAGSVVAVVIGSALLAASSATGNPGQRVAIATGALGVASLLGRVEAQRLDLAREALRQEAEAARTRTQAVMAREVHDVVGHALSVICAEAGVAQALPAADEVELRQSLADIELRARAAFETIQTLVRALRSGTCGLDDVTTGPASVTLPRLLTAARAAGLEVTAMLDIPAASTNADRVAVRVMQEALSNVIRHSGARRCEVAVWPEGDVLTMRVDDDGVGLPESLQPGNGLIGMRERIDEVGGALTVTNRLSGGTRLLAKIPLTEGA